MATLFITLKESNDRLEIETSKTAAMRIFNRYAVFLQQGEQANFKFPLEAPDTGQLVLDFGNVIAMQLGDD